MEWLQTFVDRFAEAFRIVFILQPWEQAIRTRCGRWVRKYEGGLHFKIPYLDSVFKQNCRLRITDVPTQSATTSDDHTLTIAGALRYRVRDVTPLYTKLHGGEDTIATFIQGIITEHVAVNILHDCSPDELVDHVNAKMSAQLQEWGLADYEYILTDFVRVKTYRFITGDLNRFRTHELSTDGEAE